MTVPFGWQLPYARPRKPLLARNVVATDQPLAAQAGLQTLVDGGSAFDAAVATAITLTLAGRSRTGWGPTRSRSSGTASGCAGSTRRAGRRRVDTGVLRRRGRGGGRMEFGHRSGRGGGVGGVAREVRPAALRTRVRVGYQLRAQRLSGLTHGRRPVSASRASSTARTSAAMMGGVIVPLTTSREHGVA